MPCAPRVGGSKAYCGFICCFTVHLSTLLAAIVSCHYTAMVSCAFCCPRPPTTGWGIGGCIGGGVVEGKESASSSDPKPGQTALLVNFWRSSRFAWWSKWYPELQSGQTWSNWSTSRTSRHHSTSLVPCVLGQQRIYHALEQSRPGRTTHATHLCTHASIYLDQEFCFAQATNTHGPAHVDYSLR